MKKTFTLFLLSVGILSGTVANKSFATSRSTIVDKKVLNKKATQQLLDNMIKNGSSELVIPEGYTEIDSSYGLRGLDKVISITVPKTVVKSHPRFTYGFENIIAITIHDTTALSPGIQSLCDNKNLEFINVKSDTQITEKNKILIERIKSPIGYAQVKYFENGMPISPQTLKKTIIGGHDVKKMLNDAELEEKVVNIPEGIEKIVAKSEFKHKKFQFSIVIPSSVKSIEDYNLYDDNIKAIIVRSGTTKKLVEDSGIDEDTKVFVVPGGVIDAAKIDELLAHDTPISSQNISSQTSSHSESSKVALSSINDNSELQYLKNDIAELKERVTALENAWLKK